MPQKDWNDFARELVTHVREHWGTLHRGAVLIPSLEESVTFALVFANNDLAVPEAVHQEVELIRQHLREEEMDDLGFSLSEDGRTWTLILRIHGQIQETEAGKTLQREFLKIRIEEAVQRGWASIYTRAAAAILEQAST